MFFNLLNTVTDKITTTGPILNKKMRPNASRTRATRDPYKPVGITYN